MRLSTEIFLFASIGIFIGTGIEIWFWPEWTFMWLDNLILFELGTGGLCFLARLAGK